MEARQVRNISRSNIRNCNVTYAQPRRRQGIRRSRDEPPHILKLGIWYSWVIGFNRQPISSRYPLNRRHCGAQSLCGQLGEHKYLPSLSEIELRFLSSQLNSPQHTHYTNWATLALTAGLSSQLYRNKAAWRWCRTFFILFSFVIPPCWLVDTVFIITANTTIWTLCIHLLATCFGLRLSIFLSVYVIAILPDEGSNKRPKLLAEDKQVSNTFHVCCQIYIKSSFPVLNTSRFKIEYLTQSFVSLQLSIIYAVLGIRSSHIK